MLLYHELRNAVERVDESAVEHALARLPSPTSDDMGHPLLETIVSLGPELATLSADKLADMREGSGMVFLMEALTQKNLHIASQIIELLELEQLGTGWLRLRRALEALPRQYRKRLVERLFEDPYLVPPRRWQAVAMQVEPGHDLELLLEGFSRIAEDFERDEPDIRQRGTEQALASALIDRLEANEDEREVQKEITLKLLTILNRHPFVARRLMKLISEGDVCGRSRTLLRCLAERSDMLAHGHVDSAVPAFVQMACCADDELAQLALDNLDDLAGLGSPSDWYPLMRCDRDGALGIAMHAFEQQPADVSEALTYLLNHTEGDIRRRAASSIGHRLMRGHAIGPETLQQCLRAVARDNRADVANALDVETILRHAEILTGYYAAVELLRTNHRSVLRRTLKALLEEDIRRAVTSSRSLDLLASSLMDAFLFLASSDPIPCDVEPREEPELESADPEHGHTEDSELQLALKLFELLPLKTTVLELDRAMPTLSNEQRRMVVKHLGTLGDPDWQAACQLYEKLESGTLPPVRQLSEVEDPHRAWVLIPALLGRSHKHATRALKQLAKMGNAMVVDRVARLLEERKLAKPASRTLVELRHPAGLAAMRASSNAPQSRVNKLERLLARESAESFAWPSADEALGQTHRFLLWNQVESLHHARTGLFSLRKQPPPGAPLGRVVLSQQAWWQIDRQRDDVVTWDSSLMLRVQRGGDEEKIGEWVPVSIQFSQPRECGNIAVDIGLWVRGNQRIEALPVRTGELPCSWLHFRDMQRFLEEIRLHVETVDAIKASFLIDSLS